MAVNILKFFGKCWVKNIYSSFSYNLFSCTDLVYLYIVLDKFVSERSRFVLFSKAEIQLVPKNLVKEVMKTNIHNSIKTYYTYHHK